MPLDRRSFFAYCSSLGLSTTLFPGILYAEAARAEEITVEMIQKAEALAGLSFTEEDRALMLDDLKGRLESFEALRTIDLPNAVVPAWSFDPRISGVEPPTGAGSTLAWEPPNLIKPTSSEDIAFLSVGELAGLLKSRQLTSVALTELYLSRLKQYDGVLHAVITLTEERAMQQARQADAEIAAGNWRGPLHGIPWGAKDLLAVAGYPTTWGAMPYKDQVLDYNATVVEKLDAAGAVLVAKLTLGALAWGDVWYGERTRNPWNIDQGASGSSAGPGSAVAAGLVGFAIGSETLGSIVSPSTRNGVTGHRPTFGRVSRHGAMALSWTMDKLGPMCRTAEDCALVFAAVQGRDAQDPTTLDAPFRWPARPLQTLRVGYLANAFEQAYNNQAADLETLAVLRRLGIDLLPIEMPDFPVGAIGFVLEAEASAAFDSLTRTRGTDQMVRQERNAWPNVFRHARFIPAVEYIQASRARTVLMQEMKAVMAQVDVFVTPSFGGNTLRITNLTGHPSVTVPNHFAPLPDQPNSPRRSPRSITFIGGLYQDEDVLTVANAYQQASAFHRRRPPIG